MSEQGTENVIPVLPDQLAPAPAPEAAPTVAAPEATPPPVEKGPVPYDRFHQVNEEKNIFKEQNQQLMMELDFYKGQMQNWQMQQAQPGAQPTPPPEMPVNLQPGPQSDALLEMMAAQNPDSANWLKLIQSQAKREADSVRAEIKAIREEHEQERRGQAEVAETQRRNSVLGNLWQQAVAVVQFPKEIPGFTPDQVVKANTTIGTAAVEQVRAQLEADYSLRALPEHIRAPKIGTLMKQALAEQKELYMLGRTPTLAPRPAVPGAQPAGTTVPGAGAAVTQYNSLQDQLKAGVPMNTALENYWANLRKQLQT
jgi:hypothetical protein